MIRKDQLDEIVKDCFIDLLDDLDLTYDFKLGVMCVDDNDTLYDTKEELKIDNFDCEQYIHSLLVKFNLKDERLVGDIEAKTLYRNSLQERFNICLDKFYISVDTYGYYEDGRSRIYTQNQQWITVYAYHKDVFEYLPIVIESRLKE